MRAEGFEPSREAWKASMLPLHHARLLEVVILWPTFLEALLLSTGVAVFAAITLAFAHKRLPSVYTHYT